MSRVRMAVVSAALLLGLTACSGSSPDGGGRPAGKDSPEATLLELATRIADGDGKSACLLFAPGGATIFAQQYGAADCPAAMQIVIGKVTDKPGWKAAKLRPSGTYPGVVINGNTAEFGGTCSGWDTDIQDGLEPGELGFIGLAKTNDGWLINDNRLNDPYSSCGG